MDNRSLTLNKRLKTDRYINIVFVIVEFLIGLIQLIQFIRTGDTMALRRSIHAVFGAAALFLLSLILKRIAITGKPFDTKIINLMKKGNIRRKKDMEINKIKSNSKRKKN